MTPLFIFIIPSRKVVITPAQQEDLHTCYPGTSPALPFKYGKAKVAHALITSELTLMTNYMAFWSPCENELFCYGHPLKEFILQGLYIANLVTHS